MAFQQSTRQPTQRVIRPVAVEDTGVSQQARLAQDTAPEASQSWVLFSPPTEVTSASYLSETDHSIDTPGRSQLSDLGSLNTVARSSQHGHVLLESIADEDDAELDSLDSHLPEFRSIPGGLEASNADATHALPVFPAHDGLGSFKLDRPTLGRDIQEHLYQFERFNPRKLHHHHQAHGLDHAATAAAALDLDQSYAQEAEKRSRIEAWRLEHSKVLLDEVQRQTRRQRRHSQGGVSVHRDSQTTAAAAAEKDTDNLTWHDEDAVETTTTHADDAGFITRLTRTVIKDILGLDDRLLGILLGEIAVEDDDDLSKTPRVSQLVENLKADGSEEQSWQIRILETVSRELGRLVNQLSHDPGAFTAYSRMQQMPIPYAGLPVIPESIDASPDTRLLEKDHSTHPSQPEFQPTVNAPTQPIEIPSRTAEDRKADVSMGNTFTKEEWEQDLDIKLVFRYLISRFKPRSSSSSSSGTYHGATSSQDAAARVARVRQHHPLIARSRPVERRPFRPVTPGSPVLMRHHSSCASQSTRRSARRSSCSSRHYWDIGGSLGTGSMIATHGPMGSWGEV